MANTYAAFISYSHRDGDAARLIHRRLEQFRIPSKLGRFEIAGHRNRIYPIYRDRDEARAGWDLNEEITRALDASGALIVVCSPAAAESRWVNQEVEYFASLGRLDRIFAIVVDGEPNVERRGLPADLECLPRALRAGVSPRELAAADLRKDGQRVAILKLVAGILDIALRQVADRDRAARRRNRFFAITASLLLAVAVTVLLAAVGESARRQRLGDSAAAIVKDNLNSSDASRIAFAAMAPVGALNKAEPPGVRDVLIKKISQAAQAWLTLPAGFVTKTAILDDDERVVIATSSGDLYFWNVLSGRLSRLGRADPDCLDDPQTDWPECGIFSIAVSGAGARIAVGNGMGTVTLFDKGKRTLSRRIHGGVVSTIALVDSGRVVVSGSYDKTIVYSTASALAPIRRWQLPAWPLAVFSDAQMREEIVNLDGGALYVVRKDRAPLLLPQSLRDVDNLNSEAQDGAGTFDQIVDISGRPYGVVSSRGAHLELRALTDGRIVRRVDLPALRPGIGSNNDPFVFLSRDARSAIWMSGSTTAQWSLGPAFGPWIEADMFSQFQAFSPDGGLAVFLSGTTDQKTLFAWDLKLHEQLRKEIANVQSPSDYLCGRPGLIDRLVLRRTRTLYDVLSQPLPPGYLDAQPCRRHGLLTVEGWFQIPRNLLEYLQFG